MSKLDIDSNLLFMDLSKYKIKKESIEDRKKNKKLQQESNERIKEYHNKAFNIAQESRNYIHNYDDLPRAKGEVYDRRFD